MQKSNKENRVIKIYPSIKDATIANKVIANDKWKHINEEYIIPL